MAPSFFIHPGDLSLTTGDDAVFAGLAGGTVPIAYINGRSMTFQSKAPPHSADIN